MHKSFSYCLIIFLVNCLFLAACNKREPIIVQLSTTTFAALPNWRDDHLIEVWPAYLRSCRQLNTLSSTTLFQYGATPAAIQKNCALAISLNHPSEVEIRNFFETHFIPYKVSTKTTNEGLFTGYYEPLLYGSRIKTKRFIAPLYKKPNDLITITDLGLFRKDLKGIHITGRTVDGHLKPYFTHAEIDNGVLKGNELLWVEDPLDAFFTQIQGSAAIKLTNGELLHVSYAAANGHPYTAIGKILIARKAIPANKLSMQTIRAWLHEHPNLAKEVLYQNASFVFFKESKADGPIGDQGVILTPARSLAVDPTYISYGTPIWLNLSHPTSTKRIQQLVIAQDKGGAIKGPIRGDLFWGTGEKAAELAGLMKSKGSYYLLLPK